MDIAWYSPNNGYINKILNGLYFCWLRWFDAYPVSADDSLGSPLTVNRLLWKMAPDLVRWVPYEKHGDCPFWKVELPDSDILLIVKKNKTFCWGLDSIPTIIKTSTNPYWGLESIPTIINNINNTMGKFPNRRKPRKYATYHWNALMYSVIYNGQCFS